MEHLSGSVYLRLVLKRVSEKVEVGGADNVALVIDADFAASHGEPNDRGAMS